MKVIIAGSRNITDQSIVFRAVKYSGFHVTEIVSGRANGVDTIGETLAKRTKTPLKMFPADWATFGRAAGPIRNRKMAEYADALILVWDGKSSGSANMKKEATKAGILVHEHITEDI